MLFEFKFDIFSEVEDLDVVAQCSINVTESDDIDEDSIFMVDWLRFWIRLECLFDVRWLLFVIWWD